MGHIYGVDGNYREKRYKSGVATCSAWLWKYNEGADAEGTAEPITRETTNSLRKLGHVIIRSNDRVSAENYRPAAAHCPTRRMM